MSLPMSLDECKDRAKMSTDLLQTGWINIKVKQI